MRTFSLALILFFIPIIFQTQVFGEIDEKFEKYRMHGLIAQQEGLLQESLDYYMKALKIDSTTPEIYNDLGIVNERMGDLYEAKRNYFKALEINENYLPAYSNLAYLYKKQGDFITAIEYFKKRMKLGGPKDPWTKEAGDQLRYLSEFSPELKKWIMAIETDMLSKEVKAISDVLSEVEKENFDKQVVSVKEYVAQAQAYEKDGLYKAALAQCDRALSLVPENAKLTDYRKTIVLKLKAEEIRNRVDTALQKLESGDTDSSEEDFRKILTIIPSE
ncbi:MAG: tetratricopeptide repeat protein [Candidatus Omnitrophica bacterium]|nr:tetratricopeptide repeat protein [Candidatus Omnitrophota bacterium]